MVDSFCSTCDMPSSSLELDSIISFVYNFLEVFLRVLRSFCRKCKWIFFHFCNKQSRFSEVKKTVSCCGSHLIFQLLRFSEVNSTFVKNSDHVRTRWSNCDDRTVFHYFSFNHILCKLDGKHRTLFFFCFFSCCSFRNSYHFMCGNGKCWPPVSLVEGNHCRSQIRDHNVFIRSFFYCIFSCLFVCLCFLSIWFLIRYWNGRVRDSGL